MACNKQTVPRSTLNEATEAMSRTCPACAGYVVSDARGAALVREVIFAHHLEILLPVGLEL